MMFQPASSIYWNSQKPSPSMNLLQPNQQPNTNMFINTNNQPLGSGSINPYNTRSQAVNNENKSIFPNNLNNNFASNPIGPSLTNNNFLQNQQSNMNNMNINPISNNNFLNVSQNAFNSAQGSVNERFKEREYKEKNIQGQPHYYGCILFQERHKAAATNLPMLRLADYSFIKNFNVPEEVKGTLKNCFDNKSLNEDMVNPQFKNKIPQNSMNPIPLGGMGINSQPKNMFEVKNNSIFPTIGAGNINTNFLNNNSNMSILPQPSANKTLFPQSIGGGLGGLQNNPAPSSNFLQNNQNTFFNKPVPTFQGGINMNQNPLASGLNAPISNQPVFNQPQNNNFPGFQNNTNQNFNIGNQNPLLNANSLTQTNNQHFFNQGNQLNSNSLPMFTSSSNMANWNQNFNSNAQNNMNSAQNNPVQFSLSNLSQNPTPLNYNMNSNNNLMFQSTPNFNNLNNNSSSFNNQLGNSNFINGQTPIYNNSFENSYQDGFGMRGSINQNSLMFAKPLKLAALPKNDIEIAKEFNNNVNSYWNSNKPKDYFLNINNSNNREIYSNDFSLKNINSGFDKNLNISSSYINNESTEEPTMKYSNMTTYRDRPLLKNKTNIRKNQISLKMSEELDADSMLCIRPKRYIENLNNDSFHNQLKRKSPSPLKTLKSSHIMDDTLNLYIRVEIKKNQKDYQIKISKSNTIRQLKAYIFEQQFELDNDLSQKLIKNSNALLNSRILDDNKRLEEYNIEDNSLKIVILKEGIEIMDEINNQNKDTIKDQIDKKEKNWQPILTKEGYETNPPFKNILKMKMEQIKNLENFSIENKYGKIEFKEKVDLTFQNLDQIINISENSIEAYPEELYKENNLKPKYREKLNTRALLTFKSCNLWKKYKDNNKEPDHEKIIFKLEKCAKKNNNSELMDYNPDTGKWMLLVPHFTKYGAVDDDDDDLFNENGHADQEHSQALTANFKNGSHDIANSGISEELEEEGSSEFIDEEKSQTSEKELHENSEIIEKESKNYTDKFIINTENFSDDIYDVKRFKKDNDQMYYSKENLQKNEKERNVLSSPESKSKMQEEQIIGQNLNDFSEIIDDFEKNEDIVEENDQNEISSFSFEEKNINLNINKMYCNSYRNKLGVGALSTFYQNFSFRTSWSKNGLVTLGGIFNGNYILNINKVMIYSKNNDVNAFNQFNEEVNNKSIEILFKKLSEISFEQEIKGLSIDENSFLNKTLPNKTELLKSILLYLSESKKLLNEKKYMINNIHLKNEMFCFGLMNLLFGNPNCDIIRVMENLNTMNLNDFLNKLELNYAENSPVIYYKRKSLLSKWLEWRSKEDVQIELDNFNPVLNDKDIDKLKFHQEKIKIYLSGNQIFNAAEYARKINLSKLSLFLTSFSNKHSRKIFTKQNELFKLYSNNENLILPDIYEIASGNISFFDNLDCIRWLGVYFWYSEKNSIEEIFSNFLEKNIIGKFIDKKNNKQYADYSCVLLAIFFLKQINHYEKNTFKNIDSFKDLFNPFISLHCFNYTKDILDKKILWLTLQFLSEDLQNIPLYDKLGNKCFDIPEIFNRFSIRTSRNFAAQLEMIGLWEYAVYVVIFIDNRFISNANKRNWIRNIIHRNYFAQEGDFQTLELKRKALKQIGIPNYFIDEARAFSALYNFNYSLALESFKSAEFYDETKEILVRYYAPLILIGLQIPNNFENNSYKPIKNIRELLKWLKENKNDRIFKNNANILFIEKYVERFNQITAVNSEKKIKKNVNPVYLNIDEFKVDTQLMSFMKEKIRLNEFREQLEYKNTPKTIKLLSLYFLKNSEILEESYESSLEILFQLSNIMGKIMRK